MNNGGKIIRAIAGTALLVVVFFVVLTWVLDYRGGNDSAPQGESTQTVEPTATVDPEGEGAQEEPAESGDGTASGTITVLVNGLNFRTEPSGDAELIRGLTQGATLEYLGTEGGWHKVRDAEGTVGYVSASSQYTSLQQ